MQSSAKCLFLYFKNCYRPADLKTDEAGGVSQCTALSFGLYFDVRRFGRLAGKLFCIAKACQNNLLLRDPGLCGLRQTQGKAESAGCRNWCFSSHSFAVQLEGTLVCVPCAHECHGHSRGDSGL